jgi:hypothetical protein
MARFDQVVDQLGTEQMAVHGAAGIRCCIFAYVEDGNTLWIIRYYRPQIPPYDAMSFEHPDDVIAYLAATDMLEGWEVHARSLDSAI